MRKHNGKEVPCTTEAEGLNHIPQRQIRPFNAALDAFLRSRGQHVERPLPWNHPERRNKRKGGN